MYISLAIYYLSMKKIIDFLNQGIRKTLLSKQHTISFEKYWFSPFHFHPFIWTKYVFLNFLPFYPCLMLLNQYSLYCFMKILPIFKNSKNFSFWAKNSIYFKYSNPKIPFIIENWKKIIIIFFYHSITPFWKCIIHICHKSG